MSAQPTRRWTDEQRQLIAKSLAVFAESKTLEVAAVADAWFSKGAGNIAEQKDVRLGVTGAREARASGGAAAYGTAQAQKVDLGARARVRIARAGRRRRRRAAGGQGELEKAFGKALVAKVERSVSAFGGVYARAEGSTYARKGKHWFDSGVGAAGKAKAFGGAKVAGEAAGSVKLPKYGGVALGGKVAGTGKAGVAGSAKGWAVR